MPVLRARSGSLLLSDHYRGSRLSSRFAQDAGHFELDVLDGVLDQFFRHIIPRFEGVDDFVDEDFGGGGACGEAEF